MIDSHHHLWRYSEEEYPWIPKGSPLEGDHLAAELKAATEGTGVTGTVVVQARQMPEESDFLLSLADSSEQILGVVGWVPLVADDVAEHLDHYAPHPAFVGVRHVLQDEPDALFTDDAFHRGLAQLPARDLAYDILLFQRQLPAAIALVDRQPDMRFIIDHIAKPEVHPGRVEDGWRNGMRELAAREHVVGVKFSGLATEFPDGSPIDRDTVRAYFEETLEIFGTDRVMFGTDWPVCLLRLDCYRQWVETVTDLASSLTEDERKALFTDNATAAYKLT
ncbi:amidohydrolase [Haloferula helveola]|uniref:Amidohydrolase n=1 Tax=Haloferula helveola TaxID=490095 RepID=A0ABM7RGL7_9BACT|nr:amidohydrolase [Haloferula helveola]